jgi:streptogramin lyase
MVALATSAGLNNNALGADAGGPYAIVEGDPLDLDGSATPGPPTSWAWDLDGDGQYDDATGSTPSVPWSTLASLGVDDDGDYPVALQVDGGPGSAYTTVAIDNTSPVLSTTGDATVVTGLVYTLDLAAIDPGDDTISSWTVNWGDGTIETIAGDPGSLTHTYSRSGFTFDILASATDEDGTYLQNELLAPSYDGDTVFRFEETTGAFLQEFGSVDDPIETTIGPDGRLYVSGEKSDNVVRYNAQTGAFVDEFVTPGRGGLDSPEGLAFGPDGNLYVADYTANRVLRFDGTTGAFVDVFADTGLTRPYDLVFGPDSNLYVGNYSADEVVRLDGTTGAFIDVFVAGSSGGLDTPEQMAFGPDGNLYVASFNGDEVLRFDGTTGAFVDVFVAAGGVEDLDRPAGLAFGPDGNLYVGDHRDHLVLRYDGASGAFLDEYVAPGAGGLTKPGPMAFLPEQQVTVTRPPPVTALEVANGTAHTCHTASDTPVRCRPATVRGAGASGKTVSWVSDR